MFSKTFKDWLEELLNASSPSTTTTTAPSLTSGLKSSGLTNNVKSSGLAGLQSSGLTNVQSSGLADMGGTATTVPPIDPPIRSMYDPRIQAAKNDQQYVGNIEDQAKLDVLSGGSLENGTFTPGKIADSTTRKLDELMRSARYQENLKNVPGPNKLGAKYSVWREVLDPSRVDMSRPYYDLLREQAAADLEKTGRVSSELQGQLNYFGKGNTKATLQDVFHAELNYHGPGQMSQQPLQRAFNDPNIGKQTKLETALKFGSAVGTSTYNQALNALHRTGLDKGVETFSKTMQLGAPVGKETAAAALDPNAPTAVNYLGVDPETFKSNNIGWWEGASHPERLPFSATVAQTAAGAKMVANKAGEVLTDLIGGTVVDPTVIASGAIKGPRASKEILDTVARVGSEADLEASLLTRAGKAAVRKDATDFIAAGMAPKEALDAAKAKAADDFFKIHRQSLLDHEVGRVQLRILGKPVASSVKAYEIPKAILQKMPEAAKSAIGKMFDASQFTIGESGTMHLMPKEAYIAQRAAQSSQVPRLESELSRMTGAYERLTQDQWDAIMRAKTTGGALPPPMIGLRSKLDEVQTDLANFYKEQAATGRLRAPRNPEVPEYFPAYFKDEHFKDGRINIEDWKRGRKQWYADLGEARAAMASSVGTPAHAQALAAFNKLKAKEAIYGWDAFKRLPGAITSPGAVMRAEATQTVWSIANKITADAFVRDFGIAAAPRLTASEKAAYQAQGFIKIGPESHGAVTMPLAKYLDREYWVPKEMYNVFLASKGRFAELPELRQFTSMVDKVNKYMKASVTSLNPAYYINNAMGDVMMNWLDGVNNPLQYVKSTETVFGRGNPTWRVGTFKVSGSEMMQHYLDSGARTGFLTSELAALKGEKGNPLAFAVRKAQEVSVVREDVPRLAHFADAWQKEAANAKSWEDIIAARERAAARVIKMNHDYGAVTSLEQKARQWMWFYTWLRKNLPLQLEMMVMQPGKYGAMFRGYDAMQKLFDVHLPGDPGRVLDTFVPDWLKPMTGMMVKTADANAEHGQIYMVPNTSMSDAIRMIQGGPGEFARTLTNQIPPYARIPIELTTGTRLFNQAPVDDKLKYALDQLGPWGGIINTMRDDKKSDTAKLLALLNNLLNTRMREISERQIGGQLYSDNQKIGKKIGKQVNKYGNQVLGGS